MQETLAYIAGLLDGEGSFMIEKKFSAHSEKIYYMPRIAITMCEEELLNTVKANLESGYITKALRKGNQRPAFSLTFGQGDIFWLPEVLPYLRLKKKQAQLLLDLVNYKENNAHEYTQQETLKQQVHQLNARGTEKFQEEYKAKLKSVDAARVQAHQTVIAKKIVEHTKTCPVCETGFVAKKNDAIFCSHKCRLVDWRARKKKEGG